MYTLVKVNHQKRFRNTPWVARSVTVNRIFCIHDLRTFDVQRLICKEDKKEKHLNLLILKRYLWILHLHLFMPVAVTA